MVELLENVGLRRTHAFWGDGDFIQIHFDGKRNHPLIYRENGLVIIPLRERKEVEASWRRREKGFSDLDAMWAEMEEFIQKYPHRIYFVHIDDPGRRDDEIQELSEKLGHFLPVDWSVKVGQGK